jgi:FtsZ-binding cell division protein ZapB
MTAVEWLIEQLTPSISLQQKHIDELKEKAKEMEQTNTDNKVIHFAEWLTKKHTLALINLYEQFEEEHYGDK